MWVALIVPGRLAQLNIDTDDERICDRLAENVVGKLECSLVLRVELVIWL
jgi:hypothetical protein